MVDRIHNKEIVKHKQRRKRNDINIDNKNKKGKGKKDTNDSVVKKKNQFMLLFFVLMIIVIFLAQIIHVTPKIKSDITSASSTLSTMKKDFTIRLQKANAETTAKKQQDQDHTVSGLSCHKYGGPVDEAAIAEMIFWEDIPSDALYVSPLKNDEQNNRTKYFTFEPDEGGWNNIRMAMENAVLMSLAMGRTLVLPPKQRLYLLNKSEKNQQSLWTFADFFHFESIEREHTSLNVISFEEFIKREGIPGNLKNQETGEISYPPSQWGEDNSSKDKSSVINWQRSVSSVLHDWEYSQCIASFPATKGAEGVKRLNKIWDDSCCKKSFSQRMKFYINNPTPVDASASLRFEEILAHRKSMCIYDEKLQSKKVIHITGGAGKKTRFLIHFYAFLFFEDFRQDLWSKRFIRDHLRYIDEIQCAAARIVQSLRIKSKQNSKANGEIGTGGFHTMHVRRGDFQYKKTRITIEEIYDNVRAVITEEKSTIFIATDEGDKSFFSLLKEHYNIYFLDDFIKNEPELLDNVNTNFYGMIDSLIAARGDIFMGTYFSSFTGYINRIRGYHSQSTKKHSNAYRYEPGYDGIKNTGVIQSYYIAGHRYAMTEYKSVEGPFFGREFPVGWRDLNRDVQNNELSF